MSGSGFRRRGDIGIPGRESEKGDGGGSAGMFAAHIGGGADVDPRGRTVSVEPNDRAWSLFAQIRALKSGQILRAI